MTKTTFKKFSLNLRNCMKKHRCLSDKPSCQSTRVDAGFSQDGCLIGIWPQYLFGTNWYSRIGKWIKSNPDPWSFVGCNEPVVKFQRVQIHPLLPCYIPVAGFFVVCSFLLASSLDKEWDKITWLLINSSDLLQIH